MRIILIGNYPPDRQESMERFAQMLDLGFRKVGFQSETWRPAVFFSVYTNSTTSGVGKWLGYLDKWILFPMVLRWRLRNKTLKDPNIRFHICDHSNAPYLKYLPAGQAGITCHDILAIRGALGYADAYCPASGLGKILQKWILHHLSRAQLLASVSHFTFEQLRELESDQLDSHKNWRVIHNALNADFKPMGEEKRQVLLSEAGLDPKVPFLLHVGSGLPRKNRKLLLDMVDALGSRWVGNICYAGEAADEDLLDHAKSLGLQERVISIVKPVHSTLLALYTACDAFVFPSFSEGFGWPLIEAQACGAPVIASNIAPMPEVSGGTALHADPTKPRDFADAFISLKDKATRVEFIRRGFENSRRFELMQMMKAYLELYGLKRIQPQ